METRRGRIEQIKADKYIRVSVGEQVCLLPYKPGMKLYQFVTVEIDPINWTARWKE